MQGDEGRVFKDEETGGGGVTLATSIEDVEANVKRMLNKTLVTKQTGIQGKEVTTVYIEEACEIDNEFYLSMLVDRKLRADHNLFYRRRYGN